MMCCNGKIPSYTRVQCNMVSPTGALLQVILRELFEQLFQVVVGFRQFGLAVLYQLQCPGCIFPQFVYLALRVLQAGYKLFQFGNSLCV